MTRLGFKALYGSGWQLAATKSMFPDIGVYASHDMVKLVHEMWMGIEGARNTHFYDTDGKEVLEAPPAFVDMEAGFGGPTQTFTLAVELIRARAGGVHLENQDPANRTCGHIVNVGKQKRNKVLVPRKDWLAKLKAIKAASQATGVDVVTIARTDSIDGALPDQEPGGVQMAVEDAWEAAELGVDVIWPEFNNTEIDQPQEFAEGVRKYYPDQMLGFNLSPSLYFGKAKKAGTLITNQQLGELGFTLQFSTLFNFRTAGMALEKGLQEVPEQRDRRPGRSAERGGRGARRFSLDQDAPEVRRHESLADPGAGAERGEVGRSAGQAGQRGRASDKSTNCRP